MDYQKLVNDTDSPYIATVSCNPGDTALSSNFECASGSGLATLLSNALNVDTNTSTAVIRPRTNDAVYVAVWINCFDNQYKNMQVIVVRFIAIENSYEIIARSSDKVMLNIPLFIHSVNVTLFFLGE